MTNSVRERTASSPTKKITNNDILRKAHEEMVVARTSLLYKEEFFGTLAMLLSLEEASEWCPTAATDGKKLYYNAEFILSLNPQELVFLIAHELLHCVYEHIGRRQKRDPKLWNIAVDLIVNSVLTECRIGKMINNGMLDPRYTAKSWTAEEVYADLIRRSKSEGDMSAKYGEGFDIHLDSEEEGDSESENKNDKDGSGNGKDKSKAPKISKEMAEQVSNIFKAAAISAAQNIRKAKGAGNLPAGLELSLENMIEPKIDWREFLCKKVSSLIKSDYHPRKVSRRSFAVPAIMRAMKPGDSASAMIFIDASGSCIDEVKYFLSEVRGIFEQFTDVNITIGCFDTKVYNVKTFDIYNLHEVEDYKVRGGGGTDFECMFSYMKEKDIVPEILVVFTDGFPFGSWGDPNWCDTVWIIKGNPGVTVPFGTKVDYERL